MYPGALLGLLLLSLLALGEPASAQSSIVLDGTLPNGLTDDLTALQSGPDYEVLEVHGFLSGTNLFHSFQQFDVGAGESVAFKATTPNLSNVIARVTGGSASAIDGRLESQIPGADFYLLNPAGVLFGIASSVNVPASLYVGTPTYLHFANGDTLDLVDPQSPVLSVSAPESFGFRGGTAAGPVEIAGQVGSFALEVPAGESLTFVSGSFDAFGRRTLAADGGRIQIAAVGSAAIAVPVADLGAAPFASATGLGEVIIRDQTTLAATNIADPTGSQGTIVIRGGRFELANRAVLRAAGNPAASLPSVDVAVTGEIDVRDGARISVDNPEAGTGEVRLSGDRIRVRDRGIVQAIVSGTDDGTGTQQLDGGTVFVDGRIVEVTGGGQILSSSQPIGGQSGDGNASDLRISASERVVVGGGGVVGAFTFAGGQGGEVHVNAPEILVGGGEISTTASGSGDGGRIRLDAGAGDVRVIGGGVVTTQANGSGDGGRIEVEAGLLRIADGSPAGAASTVEAATAGSGDSGAIDVRVGRLEVARSAGSDRAGRLATAAATGSTGESGRIDVVANEVLLENGGQISTTTLGDGNAGAIEIVATGDLVLRGDDVADDGSTVLPSGIFTRAGTGTSMNSADAGTVTISADSLFVEDGAEVSTRAFGTGDSGDVSITAGDRIRVAGEGGQSSAITTRGLEGQGGDVTLVADLVEVEGGGRVDVSSAGAGTGGLLTVRTGDLVVRGERADGTGSIVTARADGIGSAQGIDVDATRSVRVEGGGEITAASGGAGGSPGNVDIDAAEIVIDGGTVSAQAGSATGGDITLRATERVVLDRGGTVSVRSSGGDAGDVLLSAPEVLVRDSLITADAEAFGGEVTVNASEWILLERAQVEAFSQGLGGGGTPRAGGNVFLRGGAVVLNRSSIAADGFGNANGGNVLLSGDPVIRSTDTSITVSSSLAADGTFVVDAPDNQVTGDLASLPENFLDASSLLAEACLARDAPSGSFSVRGSEALPASPDAPLRTRVADAEEEAPRCEP